MRVMDPEEDPVEPDPLPDFAFAFDDSNFSDRVLRIEIISDSPDSSKHGGAGDPSSSSSAPTSLADWAHNRKRPRDPGPEVIGECREEEQVLNCNLLDTDEDAVIVAAYENLDDEADVMVEESHVSSSSRANLGHHGDDVVTPGNGASIKEEFPGVLRVRNIHISSPILAARSPFFYRLFSTGMRESEQRLVTIRIQASEEAAFLDLLNFMYSNTLLTNTPAALLDVLMAADRFEVASCMRECSRLLRNLPMTCESALLYLDLHSSVKMAEAVQPLMDAAKQFLASHYKDITKFPEEVLNLPLAGLEAVLSSDHLQVASEDAVYDFVLKWARTHYPRLEDRREILASQLGRLIRFPFMTCRRLKKVLTCNDFDPELASKVVLEALFYKGETPHKQRHLAEEEANATYHRFVERAYRYRPVKVVEFELPRQQCIVYLDLKREECMNLFPSGRVYSQAFHLGGQGFFLSAHCNMDQQSSFHCFGLFLGMQEKGSVSFAVDYEFAARQKPTDDFVAKYRGNYTFTGGKAVGYRNLFGLPWIAFVADDSIYFINGILHLRAELTVRQ